MHGGELYSAPSQTVFHDRPLIFKKRGMRIAQSRRGRPVHVNLTSAKREGRGLWRNDGRERQSAARYNFRYTSALSRRDASELCVVRSPRRAWGMPDAQCIRSRAWCVESTRVSHHGRTGKHPAFPHAMVLTAYFVLSPGTGLFCPRHRRNCFRQLDASVGAPGPHAFAVRAPPFEKATRRVWYRSAEAPTKAGSASFVF